MCVLIVHTYIQVYRIDVVKSHQPTNSTNDTNGCATIFHFQKYTGLKREATELSGLTLTSLEWVELQGGLVNFSTAWLIIEGLKPLLIATDFK